LEGDFANHEALLMRVFIGKYEPVARFPFADDEIPCLFYLLKLAHFCFLFPILGCKSSKIYDYLVFLRKKGFQILIIMLLSIFYMKIAYEISIRNSVLALFLSH